MLPNGNKTSTPAEIVAIAAPYPVLPRMHAGVATKGAFFPSIITSDNQVPHVWLTKPDGRMTSFGYGPEAARAARHKARKGDALVVSWCTGSLI
jgi:hypothetical protein